LIKYFSWSRELIEDATGYYSGSIYNEAKMVMNGFIGELENPSSGRTIVIKNMAKVRVLRSALLGITN